MLDSHTPETSSTDLHPNAEWQVKFGRLLLAPFRWCTRHEGSLTSRTAAAAGGLVEACGGVFAGIALPILCGFIVSGLEGIIRVMDTSLWRITQRTWLEDAVPWIKKATTISGVRSLAFGSAVLFCCALILLPMRHTEERNSLLAWTAFGFVSSWLLVSVGPLIYTLPVLGVLCLCIRACIAAARYDSNLAAAAED